MATSEADHFKLTWFLVQQTVRLNVRADALEEVVSVLALKAGYKPEEVATIFREVVAKKYAESLEKFEDQNPFLAAWLDDRKMPPGVADA